MTIVDDHGIPVDLTAEEEYEYAAQWVSNKTQYRAKVFDDSWGSKAWAISELGRLTEKVVGSAADPQPWRFELVRRLRPGPIEVVEDGRTEILREVQND